MNNDNVYFIVILYLYNQVLFLPHHFLRLFNNKLTDACTEHFASLLKAKQNFLSLRSVLTGYYVIVLAYGMLIILIIPNI